MELQLNLLETFMAEGSDGHAYKVCAFDRLVRDPSQPLEEHWEPTGQVEYRLEDGRAVAVAADGSLSIARSDIRLTPRTPQRPAR